MRVIPSMIQNRTPSDSTVIGVYLSQSNGPCLTSFPGSANGRDELGVSLEIGIFRVVIAVTIPRLAPSLRLRASFSCILAALTGKSD
jgi:hypothetical protein